jgi:tRNA-Thr(GGU) m(6)t(6)A37 methyltransferase TsaA
MTSSGEDRKFPVQPVGYIRSTIQRCDEAPLQGDEGAPSAWVELLPQFRSALEGIEKQDALFILTWLHVAGRETLQVHPRGRKDLPHSGVFATRSPARPNPIGLHRVTVLDIEGARLLVDPLEAVDGTPVIDIKPVLGAPVER